MLYKELLCNLLDLQEKSLGKLDSLDNEVFYLEPSTLNLVLGSSLLDEFFNIRSN